MSGSGYLVSSDSCRPFHSIANFSSAAQSLDEFFTTLLRFKRSALTDSIPEFMGKKICGKSLQLVLVAHGYVFDSICPPGTRSDASINFGEFVDVSLLHPCVDIDSSKIFLNY